MLSERQGELTPHKLTSGMFRLATPMPVYVVLEVDACLLGPHEMAELSERLTHIFVSVEVAIRNQRYLRAKSKRQCLQE